MDQSRSKKGLCAGFLMPHPPVLISDVGKGLEKNAEKTVVACTRAAARIAKFEPDLIVMISPHGPLFSDFLFIYDNPLLSGSFYSFGAPDLRLSCEQNSVFRGIFTGLLKDASIPAGTIDIAQMKRYGIENELDHGVLVPLYFIQAAQKNFKLLAMSSSALDSETICRVGVLLEKAAVTAGLRVCIVSSGDMSHRVTEDSPYGKTKEGAKFDNAICSAITSSDVQAIRSIDADLRNQAGECGYRSLLMMTAAVEAAGKEACAPEGAAYSSSLLSYEAPFGIGYCVAEFIPFGAEVPGENMDTPV